jgi:AraC-like DNA-binding protein
MDQSSANGPQIFQFSTAFYRARERVSAWREVFGRTVLSIDITPQHTEEFHASATAYRSSTLGLIHASTSAARQGNSRALIVNDDISFGIATAGRWGFSQLGRSEDLQPGDGVLLSNSDIGAITFSDACRYTTFGIPRSALAPLVPDLGMLFARRIPGSNPSLQMLVRYLELARDGSFLTTPELSDAFTNHVADLLALSLGATREAAEVARMRGVRAARLQAMQEDILNSLRRPDLSVHGIAARYNVTPRYVQKLFEGSGSTFTRFVSEQRLTAAYKMLTDYARSSLSISTIAYECGFTDLSNFNKAFRRRFGCTPTDVRAGAHLLGNRCT